MIQSDEFSPENQVSIVLSHKKGFSNCKDLLCNDWKDLNINSVKFIQACPRASVCKTRE